MLVTGLYFVVDGIFVGRGVGTQALAAINIAVPFISILTAVSMMITIGGATLTSIHFGKNEKEKANATFRLSLTMMLCFSLVMTLISFFFSQPIAKLLGASDLLLQDVSNYIKFFVMFGIFFCSSNTLSAFVRNDGNPHLAFWGMIVGAVSNIFLDWIFIFPLKMGLVGAAIASGLGQVLACLVLCSHFFRKKGDLTIGKFKFHFSDFRQIIKTGTPEFITQMSQPIIILCYNFIVLDVFGEMGVSAFSVISYILVLVMGVFIGLAQGIQPLLSRSFGEGDNESENLFLQKGLRLNIILAATIYIIMLLFGKDIISIFNSSPQLIMLGYDCVKIYGICFLFAAANIVYTVYYLATKRTTQALVISLLRSFIVSTICIFLMPMIFGEGAIWTGIVVAELFVMLIAMIIDKQQKRILS